MVLEKTLEGPMDNKEIQQAHPKENQSWIFIWRTEDEAEATKLWPPIVKNWLIGKDPEFGKDWRQEEKWITEDEIVGWHHWLDGHEFEYVPGVVKRQGSLACCSPWDGKELDATKWPSWTELLVTWRQEWPIINQVEMLVLPWYIKEEDFQKQEYCSARVLLFHC